MVFISAAVLSGMHLWVPGGMHPKISTSLLEAHISAEPCTDLCKLGSVKMWNREGIKPLYSLT